MQFSKVSIVICALALGTTLAIRAQDNPAQAAARAALAAKLFEISAQEPITNPPAAATIPVPAAVVKPTDEPPMTTVNSGDTKSQAEAEKAAKAAEKEAQKEAAKKIAAQKAADRAAAKAKAKADAAKAAADLKAQKAAAKKAAAEKAAEVAAAKNQLKPRLLWWNQPNRLKPQPFRWSLRIRRRRPKPRRRWQIRCFSSQQPPSRQHLRRLQQPEPRLRPLLWPPPRQWHRQ